MATKTLDHKGQLPAAFAFEAKDLPVNRLLLDPNNYRFLNGKKFKKRAVSRFHEGTVQSATLASLELSYELDKLKQSIITNGYVPMERIIVVPYKPKQGFYLVVEGNRRVASLKSLIKDDTEGVSSLSKAQRLSFSKIPCAILQGSGSSLKHVERVIMGIRHIAGPKEWGAYQQAILVSELKDDEGLEFSEIAEMIGTSSSEAARRYRAIGALKAMEDDELYSKQADPSFYKLFHEFISVPEVRLRFGWSSDDNGFEDIEKARLFFELISSDGNQEAKVQNYADVRKLRSVVGNSAAEEALFDPDIPLKEAVEIGEQGKKVDKGSAFLKKAKAALDQIGLSQAQELKAKDAALISKIIEMLKTLQSMMAK